MGRPIFIGMKTILALCFLLVFGCVTAAMAQDATVPTSRSQITLSYAPLVKQVTPAVVNIYTKKLVRQRVSPLFSDPFFQQFFGQALPQGFTRQRMENSLGSGVIVRGDGLIVTSNHVIDGADEIRVVLSDRREMDAEVVAKDEASDLAVLKVDNKAGELPYLELRDSDTAQIGELVLAIGNPFGVGQTVTSGIISAFAQRALGRDKLDYFIQTDAAINPGNSGGALVTMDGKLVGINAAIYSRDGGNMGIGFAVPSNMVRVVLKAVASGKKSITRPWLGVDGQEITRELAESMAMIQPSGMLVSAVRAGSPAAKAGLQVGDVVVSVNGHTVETPEAFRYRTAMLSVGDEAVLGYLRKGQMGEARFRLIAAPEDPPRQTTLVKGTNPLQGAMIANLSPAVAEELGMKDAEKGVVILELKEGYAAGIGVQAGDIVLGINDHKVASVDEALTLLKAQRRGWQITLQRGGQVLNLMVGR